MKYFQMTSLTYLTISLIFFSLIRIAYAYQCDEKFNREIRSLFCVDMTEDSIVVGEKVTKNINQDQIKTTSTSTSPITSPNKTVTSVSSQDNRAGHKGKIASNRNETSMKIRHQNKIVNINLAVKEELMFIRGIGEVYSTRIIKYRKMLGGFHSKKQLLEVYGFPIETFEKIMGQISCSGPILKLELDKIEFKTLLKHPYLEYEHVVAIKNGLRKGAKIDSVESLIALSKLDRDKAEKLFPYISLSGEKMKVK